MPGVDRPPMPTAPSTYAQMPTLDMPIALVVFCVNLVFPGIGTMAAGFVSGRKLVGRGIAQLVLTLIVVGWIWALINSLQALHNASLAQQAARRA